MTGDNEGLILVGFEELIGIARHSKIFGDRRGCLWQDWHLRTARKPEAFRG